MTQPKPIPFKSRIKAPEGLLSKVWTAAVVAGLALSLFSFSARAQGGYQEQQPLMDTAVLADIAQSFSPYRGISIGRYLQLKEQKDPALQQAQQNMYEILISSEVPVNPQYFFPETEQENRWYNPDDLPPGFRLNQETVKLLGTPIIEQTLLEILANELTKDKQSVQCPLVGNTIRMLGYTQTGAPEVVGLEENKNQLLLYLLYHAYARQTQRGSLACDTYFEGMNDSQTRTSVHHLIKGYARHSGGILSGYGSGGSTSGWFSRGYEFYYMHMTGLNIHELNATQVELHFAFRRPAWKDGFHSMTYFRGGKRQAPKYNSIDVLQEYKQRSTSFIR